MRVAIVLVLLFGVSLGDYLSIVDVAELSKFNFDFNDIIGKLSETCEKFVERAPDKVSEKCISQAKIVCKNKDLLWTMFDASGKFPYAGLSDSSKYSLGMYDECVNLEYEETMDTGSERVLGKYCTAGLILPLSKNASEVYRLSICIPDACSAQDLNNIFNTKFFFDGICSTKDTWKNFSTRDIIIIALFMVFACMLFISTVYDVYLHYTGTKSPHPLLLAFSVLSNGKKLFHTSHGSKDQILVFHGIKFISMWWIIAGHTYASWQQFPAVNEKTGWEWYTKRYSQYITTGHLAVDTFFFISGFLLAYMYLKQPEKPLKVHISNIPKLILHRYLRLTPANAMMYLFYVGIFLHTGSGPFYNYATEVLRKPCIDNWWAYFLYVQNYYAPKELCMVQTWYLSADFQLFLTSFVGLIPVALYIKRNFKATMMVLFAMNVFFTVLPMINLIWDLYYNEYDTHSRLVDYWIGFMMGAFMREKLDVPFKISPVLNRIIWCFTMVGMFTIILIYKEMDLHYGYVGHQVFFSLMRPAWCLGLCWITYSCYHGRGGFANWILTLPSFQIGSKLTYCMYLMHGIIIAYFVARQRVLRFFDDYFVFYEWSGHFILTIVSAIIWTLAFESPLLIIEKFIFGSSQKPAMPPENTESNTSVRNGQDRYVQKEV